MIPESPFLQPSLSELVGLLVKRPKLRNTMVVFSEILPMPCTGPGRQAEAPESQCMVETML